MALTGSTIASTYLKLLRINSDTMGADATASYIQDSADTDSALSISTTRVGIGNAAPASVLHLTGTMQVGVDGTGHDVIFYGDTPSSNMTWDESEDDLVLNDSRLLIDQDDTVIALEIDTESATTDAMKFTGPATTTGNIININAADALTTGAALSIDCGSANLASTVSGGLVEIMQDANSAAVVNNLLFVKNDHASATGTTGIYVQQDSTGPAISTTGGIVEQGGTLKENLLTNSGFDVWSNSTLLQAGTGAAPVTSGANAALTNNLLTNGGFDSATSSWSVVSDSGTAAISSAAGGETGNGLVVTDGGSVGDWQAAKQQVTLVVGKLYQFSFHVKSGTSGNQSALGRIRNAADDTWLHTISTTTTGSYVLHTLVFEAAETSAYVYLMKNTATDGTMLFDAACVYEVTPGCIAADTLAMDSWYKNSNGDIYRWHDDDGTNTHDGSFYGLKFVANVATVGINWPLAAISTSIHHYRKFESRTVTAGVWMKSWTGSASYADEIRLYEQSGTYTAAAHSGSGSGWEWVEVTHTFSASTDRMMLEIRGVNDASVMYLSQPMLVFGSSIGEGNYTRPVGEIIYLEAHPASTTLNNITHSTTSEADINLEADSKGAISKGVKAVMTSVRLRDSGSAGGTGEIILGPAGVSLLNAFNSSASGLANDALAYFNHTIPCSAAGDIRWKVNATGSNTLDTTYFTYTGVVLR